MRALIHSGFLSLVLVLIGPAMSHADQGADESGNRTGNAAAVQEPRASGGAGQEAGQTGSEAAKADDGNDDAADDVSPEEQMRRRFPQPVKAGDLIGRPVLDDGRATIGRVAHVVRTSEGKIELVVTYGGFLGWGQRLIAVPIEAVATIGIYVAILDIDRADLAATDIWDGSDGNPIPQGETIRIAVTAR